MPEACGLKAGRRGDEGEIRERAGSEGQGREVARGAPERHDQESPLGIFGD